MGNLVDFDKYLKDRLAVVEAAEARLCALQAKYESYFSEMSAVRESELSQLSGHVSAGRNQLPPALVAELDAAQAAAEKSFEEQLVRLQAERTKLARQAEKARQDSLAAEREVHQKNLDLDAKEEELKARSAALLQQIDGYNARIRELGTGFGFFSNLFSMRSLHREQKALVEEQAAVAGQIELLRRAWSERESGHEKAEAELKAKWLDLSTRASALQTKVEALLAARPQLVFRSTLEKVLYDRRPQLPMAKAEDPKCPRCKSANPEASSFCQICAQRLKPDREDLAGSLAEIAEANHHFVRFSEGMRACQEVIALARGLKSGIGAFRKSLASMMETQSRHSLRALSLDVPAACLKYGQVLERLRDTAAPELALHPKVFGERLADVTRVLNEEGIKGWFESLGQELSRQAKSQWG